MHDPELVKRIETARHEIGLAIDEQALTSETKKPDSGKEPLPNYEPLAETFSCLGRRGSEEL